MNNASGSRHAHAIKHRGGHRKKATADVDKTVEGPTGTLFTFTLDAETARIVSFALLDPGGTQRELSADEKTSLLRRARDSTLEEVIARAFEAGIQCALEYAGAADDEVDESQEPGEPEAAKEEVLLRRLLLRRLIERSAASNLLGREVLAKAVLETLIHYSINDTPAMAGQSSGATAERAAHARIHPH